MIYQPPIPPKRNGLQIKAHPKHFSIDIGSECKTLSRMYGSDMILLSAICEVEWSKRAERWRVVMRKCFDLRYKWSGTDSWDFVGHEPRSFGIMDEARRKCLQNVEDWRAYGEQI